MIKYKFDIIKVLNGYGYNIYNLRRDKLLSYNTIKALQNNEMISMQSLDTICKLLNKQPADIIYYVPIPDTTDNKK